MWSKIIINPVIMMSWSLDAVCQHRNYPFLLMTPDHHYPCPPDIMSASPSLKPPTCLRMVTSDGDVLMCCHHHLNHPIIIPWPLWSHSLKPPQCLLSESGDAWCLEGASDWSPAHSIGLWLVAWWRRGSTTDQRQPQLHNIIAINPWQQQHYTGADTKWGIDNIYTSIACAIEAETTYLMYSSWLNLT